jgi:Eukaryotic translation initiation factor 3 subunit 8 N-terminus
MLEDHVAKTERETKEKGAKLNAANQKALKMLKPKLKKHNEPYQKQITEYREVLFLPPISSYLLT